jgi:hypothetical protein
LQNLGGKPNVKLVLFILWRACNKRRQLVLSPHAAGEAALGPVLQA